MGDEHKKTRIMTMSIDSCLEDVMLISLAIRGICRDILQDDEIPGQMELSVVEAVNNAIKHAYDGQSGNEVRAAVTLRPDRIIFSVSDSGRAMTAAEPMELNVNPDDLENLPESGMGLMIIRAAMDQVDYSSQDGWNTLTMTKLLHTLYE